MWASMSAAVSSFSALPSSEKIVAMMIGIEEWRRPKKQGGAGQIKTRVATNEPETRFGGRRVYYLEGHFGSATLLEGAWQNKHDSLAPRSLTRVCMLADIYSHPPIASSSPASNVACCLTIRLSCRILSLTLDTSQNHSTCLSVRPSVICDCHVPPSDPLAASSAAVTTNNLAADLKPQGEAAAKVKVRLFYPPHLLYPN